MERRGILGGVAGLLVASAGCTSALGFGGEMFKLRAQRAPQSSIEATDVTCSLSESFVESHPKLRDVLREADETPRGEWARTDVSESVGEDIGDALISNCEDAGGLYRYDEEWYFISVGFIDGEDAADHHGVDENHSH